MTSIARTIVSAQPLPGVWTFTAPMNVPDAITIEGSLLGGSMFAHPSKRLVSEVVAEMLDEGTKRRSKKTIQETLDRYGMSLVFSTSGERLRFKGQCRKAHVPILLHILAEELRDPAFKSKEFGMVKKRLIGSLVQSKEDTRIQAGVAMSRLLYTKEHMNFRLTPDESIQMLRQITRSDLVRYHRQVIGRGSLIVAISGDIKPNISELLVKKFFATMPLASVTAPQLPGKLRHSAKKTLIVIPQKTSVDLYLGTALPVDKNHPDYYPLLLASRILGAPGFAGRLMRHVREEKGLTYGIYAKLCGFEAAVGGHLEIWGTFAPSLVSAGMDAIFSEYKKLFNRGVTALELADHKSMIRGSHLIALSSTAGRASALSTVIEEGKTPEFLDEYLRIIEKISVADINRVIRQYLKPEKLSIAAAGSIDKLPPVH